MRQSIILFLSTSLLLTCIQAQASNKSSASEKEAIATKNASLTTDDALNKEVSKIYEQFINQKNELLKTDLNKKNIKEKVEASYKSLAQRLEDVKAIESKSKADLLTKEGNEMGYDLEVLEPLKDLATGLMTKEDCVKARHEHALNFPVIEDEQGKSIQNIMNKVCSTQ